MSAKSVSSRAAKWRARGFRYSAISFASASAGKGNTSLIYTTMINTDISKFAFQTSCLNQRYYLSV
jgi:hypothetical protein